MNMRKTEIIILGIALISFIIGLYFYPQMPDEMDGYTSKFWGLMPIFLIVWAYLIAITMNMRKTEIIILGIALISSIIGLYFYPQMPDEMDGYTSKFWGVFLMPIFLVGWALLIVAISKIYPLKANIEQFRKYNDGFTILLFVFLFSSYSQVILRNIGIEISPNIIPNIFLPIGFGYLVFYIIQLFIFLNTKRR